MRDAWTLAIETLSWCELEEIGGSMALARTVRQLGIEDREKIAVANRLVKETLRRRNFVDRVIDSVLTPRSLDDFKLGVQSFLRLFTYQTRFVEDGERQAAKIAEVGRSILGWRAIAPIEEALGKILAFDMKEVLSGVSDEERIGLETFHPTWFVRYCTRLMGRSEALRFLRKNVDIPPTYIRINTLRGDEKEILARIESSGVVTEKVEKLRFVHRVIESKGPLARSKPYKDGAFFIQDASSCLAVEIGNPQPGSTVLDVCAAPGAKTTYLAQLMKGDGEIFSIDYSARRTKVLKRELSRMGVSIAEPVIADACKPLPIGVKADLVVLDPPCSSTGAFWKTPSAKWRVDAWSIRGLAKVQWMMLNSCADNVKGGGSLVYSTCSVTVEENEMLMERFLRWHPEFRLVDTEPRIGLPGMRGLFECQRFFPHTHDTNGFFVAKLVRGSE